MWDSIKTYPAPTIRHIIAQLEKEAAGGKESDQVKLSLLKIQYHRTTASQYDNTSWRSLGKQAVQLAAISQDQYLLRSVCGLLGDMYLRQNQSDTAIFYLLKFCALTEELGYEKEIVADNKIAASNVLYRTQNYRQCIAFCNTNGIDIEKSLTPIAVISAYNNTGLSYVRLGLPDSAIYFFNRTVDFARKKSWGIWEGIALGNVGDALHAKGLDEEAISYWQKDYDTSMKYSQLQNAGLTLAYISQYQFNHGLQEKAVEQLHWAQNINKDDPANLVRIYQIKAACYRKLGLHDSADFFLGKHYHLTDSINRTVSAQNFNTVQLRLDHEKNVYDYQLLKRQQQAEIIRRNFLFLALGAVILIGWLLFNRQRLKTKLARQQQAIAEAEVASARKQLNIFTETLLEKNSQIDKLNASLISQTDSAHEQLIHQTLLTDHDWNKFKDLFEKTYPSFFFSLKNMAPAVTPAEMRLAALIKLNLDNKQMASMQGISVSSLRGNKTRLRQKLNLQPETDLEEVLKQL